jgi:hypothetical protein
VTLRMYDAAQPGPLAGEDLVVAGYVDGPLPRATVRHARVVLCLDVEHGGPLGSLRVDPRRWAEAMRRRGYDVRESP